MDMGELVATAFIHVEMKKCPFTEKIVDSGVSKGPPEDLMYDDSKEASEEQANNGGALGASLMKGTEGSKDTVGGPYGPGKFLKTDQPQDSKPDRGGKYVYVKGADKYKSGNFPYLVAAHHLIPGAGSLDKSELKPFMTAGETIIGKTIADGDITYESGKSWEIACHIGYNVNGSHNGIWLPCNYAIRWSDDPTERQIWHQSPDPAGKTWSKLGDHPWCLNYVAAVSKATQRQFHDTHREYNESVEELLNKIVAKLHAHQDRCEKCAKKMDGKITPPYFIKKRLYNISNYLHRQLTGEPFDWKRPWYTSDKWRDKIFSPVGGKIDNAFLDAYYTAHSAIK